MPQKLSLRSVEAKIRELEAKAKELKQAEKPGIAQLRAVIARFKLKPADVKFALNEVGKRRASKLSGKKLKPKYRNPTNKSQTWAGRGLKPKWMAALLKQGKKLTDFAV